MFGFGPWPDVFGSDSRCVICNMGLSVVDIVFVILYSNPPFWVQVLEHDECRVPGFPLHLFD